MIFYITSILGISPLVFLHWVLAISIGILLLDTIFQTEIFSYFGIFLLASYFTGLVEFAFNIPIQWSIALFVIYFLFSLGIYYFLWRAFVYPIVYSLFMSNARKEPIETAKNSIGVYRQIDGVDFVDWNGELWNAKKEENVSFLDFEKVMIKKAELGIIFFKKIKSKE